MASTSGGEKVKSPLSLLFETGGSFHSRGQLHVKPYSEICSLQHVGGVKFHFQCLRKVKRVFSLNFIFIAISRAGCSANQFSKIARTYNV